MVINQVISLPATGFTFEIEIDGDNWCKISRVNDATRLILGRADFGRVSSGLLGALEKRGELPRLKERKDSRWRWFLTLTEPHTALYISLNDENTYDILMQDANAAHSVVLTLGEQGVQQWIEMLRNTIQQRTGCSG